MSTDFIVVGKTRSIPQILEVCSALDALGKTYYCFAKNEASHEKAGFDLSASPENLAADYESRHLESEAIRTIFEDDLAGLKAAKNLIMVLPAGNSTHIEAGIAYGLGKACYAIGNYEKTDSLYLIFDKVFANIEEMQAYFANTHKE